MKIYLTGPRFQLLEEIFKYGPRSYDHAHPGWWKDLRALQRHGVLSYRKGLWRITNAGRRLLIQRGYYLYDLVGRELRENGRPRKNF